MHVKLRNRRAYVMRSIPHWATLCMGTMMPLPVSVADTLGIEIHSLAHIVAVGREGTVLTLDVR